MRRSLGICAATGILLIALLLSPLFGLARKNDARAITLATFLTSTTFTGIRLIRPANVSPPHSRKRLIPLWDYRTNDERVSLTFDSNRPKRFGLGGEFRLIFGGHEALGRWNLSTDVVEMGIDSLDSRAATKESILAFHPPRYVGDPFVIGDFLFGQKGAEATGLFLVSNSANLEDSKFGSDESSGVRVDY